MQPSVLVLLQHATRRVLLAWRQREPKVVAAVVDRLGIGELVKRRFNPSRQSVRKAKGKGRRLWGHYDRKAKAVLLSLPPREACLLGRSGGSVAARHG